MPNHFKIICSQVILVITTAFMGTKVLKSVLPCENSHSQISLNNAVHANANATLIRSILNFQKDEAKDAVVSMWTMTVPGHRDFAKNAVRRINENNISGDIVECGVWMGGMTMLMIFENMKHNIIRHFWLFDTFDGLPEPDSEFDDPRAKSIYDDIKAGVQSQAIADRQKTFAMIGGKWNLGPIDVVRHNMEYTGYPQENIHYVKGKVEETLPVTQLPEKIAILRLDTDWYMSTKAELDLMYGRLQSGGVLIVDDYCAWKGARVAVDHFFKDTLQLDASQISKDKPCLVYWKPHNIIP